MKRPPTPRSAVYRSYWEFAAERHRIFTLRVNGSPGPWTDDPILQEHRFCNVFRAADRVSQHLIREAAYGLASADEQDLFVRVVLHRLFCRPSTWELLNSEFGPVDARSFSPRDYGIALDSARAAGERLYTGAYILASSKAYGHRRKHRNHLALIAAMLADGVPGRVASAGSFEQVFDELRSWPMIGPFMAYQLAIDLNYSPLLDFSEDDFTVPGPGARRGLAKIFSSLGDYTEREAIMWLVEQQYLVHGQFGLEVPKLFGRPLKAIDCQNLLCEVDKYSRVAFPELLSDRSRIKQRFTASVEPLPLFFPPKWNLNDLVPEARRPSVNYSAHI